MGLLNVWWQWLATDGSEAQAAVAVAVAVAVAAATCCRRPVRAALAGRGGAVA
jgi:hypothetical protein